MLYTAHNLPLVPRISEKALSDTANSVYVFNVPIDSNKSQVKVAVEKQFEVKVKDVRMVVLKGKKKLSMQKRRQPLDGRRADTKKAYVSLSEGSITILEEA